MEVEVEEVEEEEVEEVVAELWVAVAQMQLMVRFVHHL